MSKPKEIIHQNSERYKLVLLRVETFLENGKPDDVTILRMDQTAELSKDQTKNHFISAYIREEDY